jgi:hypothetical protein
MRRHSDAHIDRLEAERNKTLPPGSAWHQYWCAIFKGKKCDCDDDHRPRRPHPRPLRDGAGAEGALEKEEV